MLYLKHRKEEEKNMKINIKLRYDHYQLLIKPENRKLLPYYLYILQSARFDETVEMKLEVKELAEKFNTTTTTIYRYNGQLDKLGIMTRAEGSHDRILHPKSNSYVIISKRTFKKILALPNCAQAFVVYLFLRDRYYRLKGAVYYSQSNIAKECSLNVRTAMKVIKKLREIGVIYCTKHFGTDTLNYAIIEKEEDQIRCAQQYKELRKKRGFDSEDTEEQEEE